MDGAEPAARGCIKGRSDSLQRADLFQRKREPSMRAIMLAMTAAFIFTGIMASITTVRADETTTVIRHDDGDKTVVKKYNDDDDADKKIIIKKHED
jgi:hypothetical protein